MEAILDVEAVDKAMEGAPPEKHKEAFEAELARPFDLSGDTPLAEFGGLSPSEDNHKNSDGTVPNGIRSVTGRPATAPSRLPKIAASESDPAAQPSFVYRSTLSIPSPQPHRPRKITR